MGLFDEIHTGERCGQVKCLGKGMGELVIGDSAVLYALPWGEHEAEVEAELAAFVAGGRGEYDAGSPIGKFMWGEPSDVTSWQIETQTGYITFIDGVFTSWDDEPNSELLLVDNGGVPIGAAPERLGHDGKYLGWGLPSNLEECEVCAALASGTTPEMWRAGRAEREAAWWAENGAEIEADLASIRAVEDSLEYDSDDLTLAMLLGEDSVPGEAGSADETNAEQVAIVEHLKSGLAHRRLLGERPSEHVQRSSVEESAVRSADAVNRRA
jgi:hypothetical protein